MVVGSQSALPCGMATRCHVGARPHTSLVVLMRESRDARVSERLWPLLGLNCVYDPAILCRLHALGGKCAPWTVSDVSGRPHGSLVSPQVSQRAIGALRPVSCG